MELKPDEKMIKTAKIVCELIGKIQEMNKESEIETWDMLPKEHKQALYENILYIIKNPSTTAEIEHRIWAEKKINQGWKYGKKKNRAKKIHNCLVSFDELNFYQKLKDQVFIDIVKLSYNL